ncbi:MAG: hypothetical protein ABSB57_01010, partial [Dehalococcoidia bacterium]
RKGVAREELKSEGKVKKTKKARRPLLEEELEEEELEEEELEEEELEEEELAEEEIEQTPA